MRVVDDSRRAVSSARPTECGVRDRSPGWQCSTPEPTASPTSSADATRRRPVGSHVELSRHRWCRCHARRCRYHVECGTPATPGEWRVTTWAGYCGGRFGGIRLPGSAQRRRVGMYRVVPNMPTRRLRCTGRGAALGWRCAGSRGAIRLVATGVTRFLRPEHRIERKLSVPTSEFRSSHRRVV